MLMGNPGLEVNQPLLRLSHLKHLFQLLFTSLEYLTLNNSTLAQKEASSGKNQMRLLDEQTTISPSPVLKYSKHIQWPIFTMFT